MTQTLETVNQPPMSPDELQAVAYNTTLLSYDRAPYVAADNLMTAAQKANELYEEAHSLAGETRGRLLNRANSTLEYAALCAALPVYQEVRKELPYSNNPNLARAWVPYPNKVVPVDVFPVAVMDVLHEQALYEYEERRKQSSTEVVLYEQAMHGDVMRSDQVPAEVVSREQVQSRQRGFARVLGWLSLGRWGRKR